jgi:SNF2 family DNA or RNA helicase
MNFKDLNIKPVYNSNDDIIEFYNKTLSNASEYKRASGFFTHGLLSYISKGILGLIKNKGKFYLVISNKVNADTFDKIKRGYKDINKEFDFTKLEENIGDLAFLISIGLVEIKIAFTKGLFHEKYGLITDEYQNVILFSGSNNETVAAIKSNFESFETTLNWDCSDRDLEKINYRLNEFDTLWKNETDNLVVYDAPDALYNKILKRLDGSKSVHYIDKDSLFVDYKNKQLQCDFNFNFDSNAWYKINTWQSLIVKMTEKRIVFKKGLSVIDIENIIAALKMKMKQDDVEFLLSKNTKDFYENKVIDLEKLSTLGRKIKQKEFIYSTEFKKFEIEINSKLDRPLRTMQALGAYHITKLKRVFNFSVPGSGKTATVLGAFKYLECIGEVKKLFVLGPKNSFKSWRDEIKTVLGYTDIIDLSTSSNYDDKRLELKYDYNKSRIIFLNFEGTLNAFNIIKDYVNEDVMVVFDEIHRIKGLETAMYRATHKIVSEAVYKIALTGTPLPNGYIDLRNQFEILFGDYHKTYFGFSADNLKSKDNQFKKYKVLSEDVKKKMEPFYIRLNKDDLNVPAPNADNLIQVHESEILINKYNDISESRKILSIDKIIKKIRLGVTPKFDKKEKPFITEKVKRCIEIADDIINKNESVIIWTYYIDSMNEIYNLLNKRYDGVKYIYGSTKNEKRNQIIDDFNSGDVRILITNPQTLAESVSLHKVCNNAIYLELDYNLTYYLQSRDRIHRLGIEQDRQTNYYIMQSIYDNESIDQHIYKILNEKKLRMKDSIDNALLLEKFNEEIEKELAIYEK